MSNQFTDAVTAKLKDFVLKLRLVGVGGAPQIRRVRLARVAVEGEISYSELVNVAIHYTFPSAPTLQEDYDVVLTYYDVDNDCITIASTEELVDAVEQFASLDNPVLRITTDVKRKKGRPFTPPQSPRRAPAEPDTDEDQTEANNDIAKPKPPQLQNFSSVVESFVSVLAHALVALQNQLAETIPNKEERNTTSSANPPAASTEPSQEQKPTGKPAAKPEMTDDTDALEEDDTEDRPFIHGRHTCDGCLCTPIVGTRYHSTNLPDYDLCAKCRDNYKGNEIQFEAVELDRDAPFQDRWHRKRARLAGACQPKMPCGERAQGHGFHGPYRHGRGHPFRGHPHGRRCGGRFSWHQQQDSMDAALKEAIRRSLQDVAQAEEQSDPPSTEVASKQPEPSAPVEIASSDNMKPEPSIVIEPQAEEIKPEAVIVVHELEKSEFPPTEDEIKNGQQSASGDIKEAEETESAEENNDSSFSSEAVGHGDVAETLGKTLDECAHAIDAIVTELDRKEEAFNAGKEDDGSLSSGEKVDDGDDLKQAAADTEDDWQVVDDEMIARAAQMIGSALFQNDLSRSEDHGSASTLTNSEQFSIPSSVPTVDVEGGLSPTQLDRWALQLNQLHELGFFDDKKSVEIIEYFTAANIGVDENEEVSVNQVVNALLKQD